MKKKYDFINDLSKLKKKFIQYAKENSSKIDEESFEIEICKGYLNMRIEAEDEDEDTIVFTQEIYQDYEEGVIYQKPLSAGMITDYQ